MTNVAALGVIFDVLQGPLRLLDHQCHVNRSAL